MRSFRRSFSGQYQRPYYQRRIVYCYTCREPGHIATYCNNKSQNQNNIQNNQKEQDIKLLNEKVEKLLAEKERIDEKAALARAAANKLREEAYIFLKEDKNGEKYSGLAAKHWDPDGGLVYLRKWAKKNKVSNKYIESSTSIQDVFRQIVDQM